MTIRGVVVEGKRLGRQLGFPTANIYIDSACAVKDGVYRSQVCVGGVTYRAVSNVGSNPTVDGTGRRVESYILDFEGDIYGQEITVTLLDFIREERKFANIEELRAQIKKDVIKAIRNA